MRLHDLGAREERVQWDAGSLQRLAATLLAVDEAERLGDDGAGLENAFLRLQERSTGRERVVDEQNALALAQRRPLDRAAGAVRLDLLADDECRQRLRIGTAQRGDRRGDRVSAQRQTTDSGDVELAAALQPEKRHQVKTPAVE